MFNLYAGTLQWLDWVILFFCAAGLIYGIGRGFMREIAEVAEFSVLIYLVMEFYPKVSDLFQGAVKGQFSQYLPLVTLIAVSVVVGFVIHLIDSFLRRLLSTTLISPLRMLGGALLGAFHGLLLSGLTAQILILAPVERIQTAFHPGGSVLGGKILTVAPRVHQTVERAVRLIQKI